MYLAYVGHGFQGMQRNPGARTIEDELFRALHRAGAISDANADENGFIKARACGVLHTAACTGSCSQCCCAESELASYDPA